MEKQIKQRFLSNVSIDLNYLDYSKLESVIPKLQGFYEVYLKEGYSNISLKFDSLDCDDDPIIELWGESLETDEEFNKRVEYENRLKVQKEESKRNKELEEMHEYERLKRKFEHSKNTQEKL